MNLLFDMMLILNVTFVFCLKALSYNPFLYQKTIWLAIFYMCIPTGFALGYVYGGLVRLIYSIFFMFEVHIVT